MAASFVASPSPVFGRPSPAADRPGRLRVAAGAGDAAYRADGGDGPSLSLRAASIAGVRHRLAGDASDDAYVWRWVPAPPAEDAAPSRSDEPEGGWLVVAVADGVGTVPGSDAAAAAAVSAACDAAAGALLGKTAGAGGAGAVIGAGGVRPAGGRDRAGILDVAGVRATGWWTPVVRTAADAVREVGGATTVVVAVIDARGSGAAARVGDSTALVLADGQWRSLWAGEIDDGSLSTATAALPASSAVEVAAVDLASGEALVLVTDGIANPLHDGPTTVAPALASALAAPPTPLQLAVLADFSRQGCFDDRTILGVWVRPQDAAGAGPI